MMDDMPFRRFNYASCKDVVALDYSNLPTMDTAFASNFTTVILCGRQYPIDFSKNMELKFTIPSMPQFMDVSGLQFRLQMQIVDKETGKPFTGADHKMSVICGVGSYT